MVHSEKLKVKDIRLMLELFKDGRASNRQLAKAVGISKETVSSRIKHFEREKLIRGYPLQINYNLLGFKEIQFFIRLKKADKNKIKEVLKFLVNHHNSSWVAQCFGEYDFKVAFQVKSIEETPKIVLELRKHFSENIDYIDNIFTVYVNRYSPKWVMEKMFENEEVVESTMKLSREDYSYEKPSERKVVLDELDKQILFELGQSARNRSFIEIAQNLNISSDTVKNRYMKMRSEKVIVGTSAFIETKKFNKIWGIVLFDINAEKIDLLKEYLNRKIHLSHYTESMGQYNFQVGLFARDVEELYNAINSIRGNFTEYIEDYKTLLYFDIHKTTQIPKCVLD